MLEFLRSQTNQLLLQIGVSISVSLALVFLKIPVLFLRGLHTYIHPDSIPNHQNGAARAAIRRPSGGQPELRRRGGKDNKFEFDESNAQIFRLKLDEGHLQSRLFYEDYRYCFIYSSLGFSSFGVYWFLSSGFEKDLILGGGSAMVPLVFGFVSFCKVFVSLGKAAFEKSASRRSERQLSLVVGFLGFAFGMLVSSGIATSVIDFDLGGFDVVFLRVVVAALMGCLVGFLYIPAEKNARSFWLGTDQLQSGLEIVSCGWFARMILCANLMFSVVTVLLWVKPVNEILIDKNSRGTHLDDNVPLYADRLAGNVGFKDSEFGRLRIYCLLISGILQIMALRPNLQMYLNEALLSWYQRLHASKVPDLDFSRAKVFLHNHFLCLAVLQFLVPPVLMLLFLGLSQIDAVAFNNVMLLRSFLPCAGFLKEASVLMAWWVVFIWAAFTLVQLLMYRHGFLLIS